ncbi:MAG: hypothetical protein LBC64_01800 [Fibromonadaceae bacterium]|jgi:hypothetical protein|nr:hypothetical protein [Fibromonadaceae bacterium]
MKKFLRWLFKKEIAEDKSTLDILIKIRALITGGNLHSVFVRDMSAEMLNILIYKTTDNRGKAYFLEQLYSIYADIEQKMKEEKERTNDYHAR